MRLLLLAVLVFSTTPRAAELDGLHSAECSAALTRLQAHEDQQRQAAPIDDDARVRWLALRKAAARRCLGGDGSPVSPSQHGLRMPIVVAPIRMAPGIVTRPAAAVTPAASPNSPPLTLTSCDATGCLASDGSRLTRAGAGLTGPKGLCTVQGLFVQCP